MKKRLLPLLSAAIILTVLIAGCIKPSNPGPPVLPVGNFTGVFTRLHYNGITTKVDTIRANITLTMNASTGYAVGGDTSQHAASHGGYIVDGTNIAFSDATLPSITVANPPTPTKTHLNGVYQYTYVAGSSLNLQQITDTLAYFYNMTAH